MHPSGWLSINIINGMINISFSYSLIYAMGGYATKIMYNAYHQVSLSLCPVITHGKLHTALLSNTLSTWPQYPTKLMYNVIVMEWNQLIKRHEFALLSASVSYVLINRVALKYLFKIANSTCSKAKVYHSGCGDFNSGVKIDNAWHLVTGSHTITWYI